MYFLNSNSIWKVSPISAVRAKYIWHLNKVIIIIKFQRVENNPEERLLKPFPDKPLQRNWFYQYSRQHEESTKIPKSRNNHVRKNWKVKIWRSNIKPGCPQKHFFGRYHFSFDGWHLTITLTNHTDLISQLYNQRLHKYTRLQNKAWCFHQECSIFLIKKKECSKSCYLSMFLLILLKRKECLFILNINFERKYTQWLLMGYS